MDGAFHCRARKEVHLGPVRIEIRSNEPDFKGLRFFSKFPRSVASHSGPDDAPDFTLSLCNLGIEGPWLIRELSAMRDQSYRAKRMSAGYYLTDHFGAPAYLLTRGRHYWIFAEDFESILWPYAVKYLLTLYSIEHNLLHLKAAGVAVDGQGALLIGRGGSGKTVLLTQLCQAGAQYLSNTHVLLRGQELLGIGTTMRVRADRFFSPAIAERRLSPSVKEGEYIADPVADLGWRAARSAPMRTVCLIDYKESGRPTIRAIDSETLFNYMEQFALAVNVYGLKEDVLDCLGHDVERFSVEMAAMRSGLRSLVNTSCCYYLSCDAADARTLQSILDLLKRAGQQF